MTYNFSTSENAVSNFTGTTAYGYQYDLMNRLTKGDAAVSYYTGLNATQGPLIGDEEMTYDKSGNITLLKRGVKGSGANFTETDWWNYTYLAGTNKLSGVTGQNAYSTNRAYTYDANGNLLTDNYRTITQTTYGRVGYAYNLTKGSDAIDSLYDTKDQRVYKKITGSQSSEEYYLQDAFGKTVAIKEVAGTTGWEYYISGTEREMSIKPTAQQAPGTNVSNTAKRVSFGQTFAFLYDHLGSMRVSYSPHSWDATAGRVKYNVNHAADYTPYGRTIREFVWLPEKQAKYLTTQHERDNETGLDYCGEEAILNLKMHEYGHYLQFMGMFGGDLTKYLTAIGIPSLWSASRGDPEKHHHFWTEISANKLAYLYFKQPIFWNSKKYPFK